MNTPLVSVIMNCYNGEKYLSEAIQSVIDQTYSNWEIIFWDNCSTDSSSSIALSYKDDRIKYFRNEINESLGTARNKAIIEAKGDYIAFLDTDDFWLSDKLTKQIRSIENIPNVGLVYSDFYFLYQESNIVKQYSLMINNKVVPSGYILKELLRENIVNWQTILINRKIVKKELRFNESFSFVEDYELLLRLAVKYYFLYINEPLVYYRVHQMSITSTRFDIQSSELRVLYNEIESILPSKYLKYRKYIIASALFYELKGFYSQKKYVKFSYVFIKLFTFLPLYLIKIFLRKLLYFFKNLS